jgi:hypothetical protein
VAIALLIREDEIKPVMTFPEDESQNLSDAVLHLQDQCQLIAMGSRTESFGSSCGSGSSRWRSRPRCGRMSLVTRFGIFRAFGDTTAIPGFKISLGVRLDSTQA